jgi:hypothetical protein
VWLPAPTKSMVRPSTCQQGAARGFPIMDETKPTSAPASANRGRLAGIKRSVTRALTVVALLVALCIFLGLPLILSGVIVFLASSSAALFTFLVVTAVMTELSDDKEWARTRLGEKQASMDLRPFFADLGGILRPVLRPFSSWRPFRLGRFGEAVLLPDSMAIFGVCLASLAMTSIVMTSASISRLVGQQPVTSSFSSTCHWALSRCWRPRSS